MYSSSLSFFFAFFVSVSILFATFSVLKLSLFVETALADRRNSAETYNPEEESGFIRDGLGISLGILIFLAWFNSCMTSFSFWAGMTVDLLMML